MWGEPLPEEARSWSFVTLPLDIEPPVVTLALLRNPALTSYVTAVAISDEPLYPADGAVKLVVDGEGVALAAQGDDATRWIGSLRLTPGAEHTVAISAVDRAGNPPAEGPFVLAAVNARSGRVAMTVPGSSETAYLRTTSDALVLTRMPDARTLWIGPEDAEFERPAVVTFPAGMGSAGALRGADGVIIPLVRQDGGFVGEISSPGIYSIVDLPNLPSELWLGQNRPNPFNPTTLIPLTVPAGAMGARLTIWSASGQRVREFPLKPGAATVRWDGTDDSGRPVASGAYAATLEADGGRRTIRLVVVR